MPDPGLSPSWQRRERGNAPASYGGVRQSALARRLPAIAPAPQQKGGDAGAFRGELQSAARHHGERPDFADNCDNARGAQPFLHRPQDLGIARRPDQHDSPGIEPMDGQTGAVKIRAALAPHYHSHLIPTLSAL